jgi:hypothetical protein
MITLELKQNRAVSAFKGEYAGTRINGLISLAPGKKAAFNRYHFPVQLYIRSRVRP